MGASMTDALEEAIRFTLPWTAAVAIVLPDDAEVPDLDGRKVFRIPAASAATFEQIESLRAEGYEYLIVPAGAREWLKPDLRVRLEERHRLVIDDAAAGALFALHGPPLAGIGPDDLPLPPIDLVRITSGCIKQALTSPGQLYRSFYETGVMGARYIQEALARNGAPLETLGAMLDLGCGCGRIMRHWSTIEGPALHGCDYNPLLVEWCSEHLSFADFAVNPLEPDLPYANAQFDLVYAISVFTHLDAPLQLPWIEEVTRVVKPGGRMLITVNGAERAARQLKPGDLERFEAGELVVRRARSSGTNACAVFHPEPYVRTVLGRGLQIAELVPAGASDVRQDLVLLRKPV
jgi:SAM-dependent methyltransferase